MPKLNQGHPKSDRFLLGSITQVYRTLLDLSKKRLINKFSPYIGINKDSLEFKVYFFEENYFILNLSFARFHPQNGAEIGKVNSRQLTILVDRVYDDVSTIVSNFILTQVKDQKRGVKTEKLFEESMQWLIDNDPQIAKVVLGVKKASQHEDMVLKIDYFFFTSVTTREPVQIKTDDFFAKAHVKSGSDVPTITRKEIKNLELLKKRVLEICCKKKIEKP